MSGKSLMHVVWMFLAFAITSVGGVSTGTAEEPATEQVVAEEEPLISGSASFAYLTDYIFRGQSFFDGPSMQPAFDVAWNLGDYGRIVAGTFFHFSNQANDTRGFWENDQNIAYDKTIGIANVSLAFNRYTFPNNNVQFKTFGDLSGSVTLDLPLTPSLTVYREMLAYYYLYYEPSISHSITLQDNLHIDLYGSMGFASNSQRYYQRDGLEVINTGAALRFTAGDWTIAPGINFVNGKAPGTVDLFWGGLNISTQF